MEGDRVKVYEIHEERAVDAFLPPLLQVPSEASFPSMVLKEKTEISLKEIFAPWRTECFDRFVLLISLAAIWLHLFFAGKCKLNLVPRLKLGLDHAIYYPKDLSKAQ